MLNQYTPFEKVLLCAAAMPVAYFLAIAIGRLLKQRFKLRLGLMYQLLCAALALYLPLTIVYGDSTGMIYGFRKGILAAGIVLFSFFAVALVRRFVLEGYFEKRRHVAVPNFARDVLGLIFFIIAVVIVMDAIYGLSIKGVMAGSGIAAIIIGFAMQDLLGNLIGGMFLEIGQPFHVGDWLNIEGEYARVIEINWRSVRLITNDEITLDIPNSKIVRLTIHNLQFPTREHAIRVTVGVDYNVPPNIVKDICVRAAKNAAHVLKMPAPKAFLIEFGESSILYQVKFYMDQHRYYNDTCDAVRSNIWYELRRAGITIPFPIRTLHIERKGSKQTGGQATAVRALQLQPVFEGLSEEQINKLVEGAKTERFGRREHIIRQDADGGTMFILIDGSAEVYVESDTGEPALVSTLRAGDCFGEMSLLTGEKRSAAVIAVSDCEVLEIGKSSFRKLVQDHRDILDGLSALLAARKMETEGILAAAATNEAAMAVEKRIRAGILARFHHYFEL